MPGDVRWRKLRQTKMRIQYKPEKVFDHPKNRQRGENPHLQPECPGSAGDDRPMKEQRHKGKNPGVVASHRTATPENLKQPVRLNTPGRQIGRPPGSPFNLNFNLRKEKAEDGKKQKVNRQKRERKSSCLQPQTAPLIVSRIVRAASGLAKSF